MIIVRYGEIGLKARNTRREIETKLVKNIASAISKKKIIREFGRIFVDSDSHADAEKISRVFGVVSTSVALKTSPKLEEIVARGAEYAKARIKNWDTFAVKARRTGKHEYGSRDVGVELGKKIAEETGAKVNLTSPDKTIYVEVRENGAYIFDEVINGVGGLPLSTQGRAVTIMNCGDTDAVAAWMLMKRGVEPVCVYFDAPDFFDKKAKGIFMKNVTKLAEWKHGKIKTYLVPYGEVLSKIAKNKNLTCALCKRSMFKIAEKIAEREDAKAIVTGDSLEEGQEKIGHFYVVDSVAVTPIFRPLIGMNNEGIKNLEKMVGVQETSTGACCPIANYGEIKIEDVKAFEKSERIENLLEKALEKAEVVEA